MGTIRGFARPQGVRTVRNGVGGEGGDGRACDLGNLAVSHTAATGTAFSGSPAGHCPLGVTAPLAGPEGCSEGAAGARITSGSALTLLHQPLPGLSCLSPPPSFPSAASQPIPAPLSRLAAPKRGSGAGPALCSSCDWEKLQDIYPPAQPEMLTYSHMRGSPEVPASGGTVLRGRNWEATPASRSEPERGSALRPQPLSNPCIPYKPPTSTAYPATRITPNPPNLLSNAGLLRDWRIWGAGGGRRWWRGHPFPLPLSTHSTAASTASRRAFMVRTMWPERCAGRPEERRAGGRAGSRGWGKGGGSAQRVGPGPRAASPLRLPGRASFRFPARENRARGSGGGRNVSAWQRLADGEQSQLSPSRAPKGFFQPPFGSSLFS